MSTSSPHKAITLKIHEWLAVALLIAILGALSMMAYLTKGSVGEQDRSMPAFLSKSGKIEVLIEGAVINPGTYYLPSGIAMKDVLMLAQLLPNADLRRFNMSAQLKKGRVVNVPSKSMITINLKGAVENPGEISVPKGTRLVDLKALIQLGENVDSKALNRKRKLKDGETVTISK
ncbi:MAG: SLBB domain-containing protein [Parachlamydiaceae bacterium]|nr:SLBB domain-containing protein [Parachlamydiaceae bacterium]